MNSNPAEAKSTPRLSTTVWAVASLILATIWLYWPTLGFDFLNWDDPWYVQNNELIRSWHPANLARIATESVARNFAPLTILSFLADYSLWGLQPAGFHLTNVLLHATNGVLVFFLMRQLTDSRMVAWSTALLFVVHPTQVETVAWISSRKGLLSASFMLCSLLFWFRRERTNRDEAIGLGFLVAALLSKAIAVMLPPIVLLYDVLVRRRPFGESLVRQLVPGVAAFLLLAVTMSSQTTIVGGLRDHLALSKMHLLAVDTTLLWTYVGKLVFPHNLSVLYNPPTSGIAGMVILSCIGLAAVAVLAWRLRHARPLVTLGICCFYLLFLPVLNLFPLTTLINDRYLYLPSIAFFGIGSAAAVRAFGALQPVFGRIGQHAASIAAVSAVAIALVLNTTAYLPVWQNSSTLWTHAMQRSPELMVVRIQMAYTLHGQGRELQALRVLRQAMQDCPANSVDRDRIDGLYNDWLVQLAEDDQRRQRELQRRFGGTSRQ